jgi:hypothetical protein
MMFIFIVFFDHQSLISLAVVQTKRFKISNIPEFVKADEVANSLFGCHKVLQEKRKM